MRQSQYNIWSQRGDGAYVFNGVSGGVISMSERERRQLLGFLDGDDDAAPVELLEELIRGRMLVSDDADEVRFLSDRYRLSRQGTSTFALTIVTSLGCNFDCPYCFEAKHPSIVTPEVEASILRILDDRLPAANAFHVSWFGGEPLVGKRPLLSLSDAFIARCDAAGVAYTADIITNGYFLDDETCRELQERRVTSAQITIDGPPDIHDRMRPLVGGQGTFARILENLPIAAKYMGVTVRVNLDAANWLRTEELFRILQRAGLSEVIGVYPGQLVGVADGVAAPSASYGNRCLSNHEFADVQRQFAKLARSYGFAVEGLPGPVATPCTAVRANELIIGSEGELYKCWESVGNRFEVIGHVDDYENTNGRLAKWLRYDPFSDPECRQCMALPVCMGGCAHHAMDLNLYENRCGTFRWNYQQSVDEFIELVEAGEAPSSRRSAGRQMETR